MSFEHPQVPGAYDRTSARPDDSEVIFVEERFLTGADLNDGFSIARRQAKRLGNGIFRDGDRYSGAAIEVLRDTGTLMLGAGEVYVEGDVRPVAAAVLSNLDLNADLVVGVRLISNTITPDDVPDLLGLAPGSEAEGEKGAVRIEKRLVWGYAGDGAQGKLYPVYTLKKGTPLDQTPPAELSQVSQTVGLFDLQSNGNYIAEGCRVTAMGLIDEENAPKQVFSIAAGVGNINGHKRVREYALRMEVPVEWDTLQIDGESHTYLAEPSENYTIRLRHGPLDSIRLIQLEQEITETVTRSAALNGKDPLTNNSIKEIVEVKQGGTIYNKGTDYQLTDGKVDWSLSGAEPSAGSTYAVTYRFRKSVDPVSRTLHEITLTGGRNGGEIIVTYLRRLPRIDLICLDEMGNASYEKGQSAVMPLTPATPDNLLRLTTVYNDFDGLPQVRNDGTHNYTYDDLSKVVYRLNQALDAIALNRLEINIHEKEPAAKRGIFVDPFVDDRFRDRGEPQSAAVRNGMLTLPLSVSTHNLSLAQVEMLPHEVEQAVRQPIRTTCKLINRFANHEPFPAQMKLDPATDFWVEVREVWESDVTHRLFGPRASSTEEQQVVGVAEENAEFLREVTITVTIDGFGDGEILDKIIFDNVDMTPTPNPVADDNGRISIDLVVPAGRHAAGEKLVEAKGRGGSEAFASFVGQGEITTRTMQRVTTLVMTPPPPPPPQVIVVENRDPRGQTFMLPREANRHVATASLWFCEIGNPNTPVVVEIRETNSAGYPTDAIVAQAVVDMSTVIKGKETIIPFPSLPFLLSTRQYALIAITPDNLHSISAAVLGGFDDLNQRHLGANPYTVGVEIESSNNSTWTALHGSDLAFGVGVARFTTLTKRVELGTADLNRCSDLMIAAAVDIPEAGCSVVFEITRASGEVLRTSAYAPVQFDDWVTEQITVAAILKGTETASPRLFPGIQIRAGQLAEAARYVSLSFNTDNAVRFPVRFKRTLPAGATAEVFLKNVAGNWINATELPGEVLDELGTVDATYELAQSLGQQTAVKIEVTGNPAARPVLEDLRAAATV